MIEKGPHKLQVTHQYYFELEVEKEQINVSSPCMKTGHNSLVTWREENSLPEIENQVRYVAGDPCSIKDHRTNRIL